MRLCIHVQKYSFNVRVTLKHMIRFKINGIVVYCKLQILTNCITIDISKDTMYVLRDGRWDLLQTGNPFWRRPIPVTTGRWWFDLEPNNSNV